MNDIVRAGRERRTGRSLCPKIINLRLPFEPHGYLLGPSSKVLDLAMGYGTDLAQIKAWFPSAHCVGVDRYLVLTDECWESEYRYTYGMARRIVRHALDADLLTDCVVRTHKAEAFHRPFVGCFTVILCFGLLHQFRRKDQQRILSHALRYLTPSGILCVRDPIDVINPLVGLSKGDFTYIRETTVSADCKRAGFEKVYAKEIWGQSGAHTGRLVAIAEK